MSVAMLPSNSVNPFFGSPPGAPTMLTVAPQAAVERVAIVVLSKDRPLQVDGTLRSLFLHADGISAARVTVLYRPSSDAFETAYEALVGAWPQVTFVRERAFKDDLQRLTEDADGLLFVSDDTLFVRPFALAGAVAALASHADALGFSLRLGRNTVRSYRRSGHVTPAFAAADPGVLSWSWGAAAGDFAEPFDLTSALYRAADLRPLLRTLDYRDPESLGRGLLQLAPLLAGGRSRLLAWERSVAFSAPLNHVAENRDATRRTSADPGLAPEVLLGHFARGVRIDVGAYVDYQPSACEEEIVVHTAVAEAPPPPVDPYALELAEVERALESGARADAIARLERFVATRPDHVVALRDLAVLYSGAERRQDAVRVLERARTLAPHDGPLQHALAAAQLMAKDAKAAHETLAPLLVATPHDPDLLVLAAEVEMARGEMQAARARLAAALDVDPNHRPARLWRDALEAELARSAPVRAPAAPSFVAPPAAVAAAPAAAAPFASFARLVPRARPFVQTYWQDKVDLGTLLAGAGDINASSRQFVRRFAVTKGMRTLLDVGCGLCTECDGLRAEALPITYKGIDATPRLVDFARARGLDVQVGYAENLPLPDRSPDADLVLMRHLLEHLPTFRDALDEAMRVAGREVVVVFATRPDERPEALSFDPALQLYRNRYNRGDVELWVRSRPRFAALAWHELGGDETALVVSLK